MLLLLNQRSPLATRDRENGATHSARRTPSGKIIRTSPLIALMLGIVVCAAAQDAPRKVTAVRFSTLGDMTRVIIDVSSDFNFRSGTLTEPDRLFFDIPGERSDLARAGTYIVVVGDSILKQIRLAEHQPGLTRMVLDFQQPAESVVHQSRNPNRLEIELRPKNRATRPTIITSSTISPSPSAQPADLGAAPAPSNIEPPIQSAVAAAPPVMPEPDTAAPNEAARPTGPVTDTTIPAAIVPPSSSPASAEASIPAVKEQKYKLTILEAASTSKRAKKGRVSSQAVIKVTDENDLPVPGVAVAFTIPQFSGGATFTNGATTSLSSTNASGIATSQTFTTTAGSSFTMGAAVSAPGGGLLTAAIPAATSAAVAAGISTSALIGIVAAVGAAATGAAVGGLAAAGVIGGGGGKTATVSVGVPVFK